jgi:hypothetical protein
MKRARLWKLAWLGCMIGIAGCAQTRGETVYEYGGPLPRPDRILVYDFSVSPDEVQLDRGIGAKLEGRIEGMSPTEAERAIGRRVANTLAEHLVREMQALGFVVTGASGDPPTIGNLLTIEGHFLSIDEGNRTERTIIGLGAGRTDVGTVVEVSHVQDGKRIQMLEFETDAKSGAKPGIAETMGIGAATGRVAASAAAGVVGAGVSGVVGDTVEADAGRTAKEIAKMLKDYFGNRGWLY